MAAVKAMAIALFLLCLGLAWFDFRSARIPNPVTLALLAAGLLLGLPGNPGVWTASLLLVLGWKHGWLGGGDAKLWLALLWLAAGSAAHPAIAAGVAWFTTGLAQLGLRVLRGQRLLGIRGPGAWRALPFAAWLVLVS